METNQMDTKNKKKILLVEDDNALADVYMNRLTGEGFEVRRVDNGEDALANAVEFHPDLIVLDVMMPKISGFEVLDILKNTPATTQIKVMMLTALGQESDQKKAKDLGADDYLVKSQIATNEVIKRIESLV
jgi:DNA-binding response OmpR family regulator